MARINEEWLKKQYTNEETGEPETDEYVLAILKVGECVLDLMEKIPESDPVNANDLILEADRHCKEGITGNMAAYVAMIATKCHSRGEEFRKSWNIFNGNDKANEKKGAITNPAIMTIG